MRFTCREVESAGLWPAQVLDAKGKVINRYIKEIDFETGEVICRLLDSNNCPVIRDGETVDVVEKYEAPLSIRPKLDYETQPPDGPYESDQPLVTEGCS